jgi:pimeloyl-ACP methyl ester carboxylesterase
LALRIVLVHGGWHGSWCWERVLPLLAERGLEARTVDLPSCGPDRASRGDLDDDASAVRAAVHAIDGPVMLVAHSWGGVVVTEAAVDLPAVSRLVFLCAYVPDAGESVASLRAGRRARPWIRARDGALEVDPAAARDVLYHDCDPETAAWAIARLVPQNAACVGQAPSVAAWRALPCAYVRTARDRVVPHELQEVFAARADEAVELPTGHSPFLARPELVADVLARQATASTRRRGRAG